MENIINDIISAGYSTWWQTWQTIPILFAVYILISIFDRSRGSKIATMIEKGLNPVTGGLFGCIPQCGISVAVADLFNKGKVTIGTIIASFIVSSDEAIAILMLSGRDIDLALMLVGVKLVIGISLGIVVDKFWKAKISGVAKGGDIAHSCECCDHTENIILGALKHTAKTYVVIFVVAFIFKMGLNHIGTEGLATIMLSGNVLQPLIVGLIGFIPSCATSIVIAQLLVQGHISFASAIAGLMTNAGFGIIVLLKGNESKKLAIKILGLIYLVASITGLVLSIFM